jgi:hypothetical protein
MGVRSLYYCTTAQPALISGLDRGLYRPRIDIGLPGLAALPAASIIGQHDGLMDDGLLDILIDTV